jgi:hypothetical protein
MRSGASSFRSSTAPHPARRMRPGLWRDAVLSDITERKLPHACGPARPPARMAAKPVPRVPQIERLLVVMLDRLHGTGRGARNCNAPIARACIRTHRACRHCTQRAWAAGARPSRARPASGSALLRQGGRVIGALVVEQMNGLRAMAAAILSCCSSRPTSGQRPERTQREARLRYQASTTLTDLQQPVRRPLRWRWPRPSVARPRAGLHRSSTCFLKMLLKSSGSRSSSIGSERVGHSSRRCL